jgi:hypothetical protein
MNITTYTPVPGSQSKTWGNAALKAGKGPASISPKPVSPESVPPKSVPPKVEFLAHLLDDIFVIPGTGIRFGLDGLLGLIPGLGDTLTSLASFYILGAARQYGVPRVTLVRMAGNIAIDYLFGMLPFLGDAFDVYWKANRRNVQLLERHFDEVSVDRRHARRGDWLVVAGLIAGLITLLIGCVTVAWWIVAWVGHGLLNVGG